MIKGITSDDLQQLAQGIVPAYLQRYPLPELVQELATRLVYAENERDEIIAKLEEYYERENNC